MNIKPLWKPFTLYAGLLGLLTVGTVYLVTHSGLLLLVVLGGGTAGPTSASGAEHADDAVAGMMVEDMGLWPNSYAGSSLRVVLLLYGLGVFLWSLIVLVTLSETLV